MAVFYNAKTRRGGANMATVSNTLRMKDSMGSVLKSVITSMNMTISTMERMNSASDNIDLSSDFEAARKQIGLTTNQLSVVDDEIRKASIEQDNFNNKIRDGTNATSSLKSMFIGLGGAIGLKKLVDTSDSMAQINARLDLIKAESETTESLRNKIFASANDARGLYTDMASSITKLGLLAKDAFSNNNEIIEFTNLFQKLGVVGGTGAIEMSSAMYQLNQAMASGRLQGDEYRAIIENAPLLAQAIEKYLGDQGVKGTLKEMSSEGLITSDVIKIAMFSIADEVNEKFKNMPLTWGQLWNRAINTLLIASQPLLGFINLLANNWSILEPIVLGVTAVLILYTAAIMIHNGVLGVNSLMTGIAAASAALHAGKTLAEAAATETATGAQIGLNAALLASPITWIIIGIIALIAVFYAAIAAVNNFAGTSISATGLIAGAFTTVGAFIGNIIFGVVNFIIGLVVGIWNMIISFANFLGNIFNDPIAAIMKLFLDLFDSIVSMVQSSAKALDTIFGSNLSGSVKSFRDEYNATVDDMMKDRTVDIYQKLNPDDYMLERLNYGDAFNTGYKFGEGIDSKLSNIFSLDNNAINTDDLMAGLDEQEFDVNVKDDVNLADESLKYLLDDVTQKYINNINLQAPAPTVSVNVNVASGDNIDYDEVAEITKKKLGTEMVEFAMSSTDIRR